MEHQVSTIDAQPSNAEGGIIVVVSGALLVSQPSDGRLRSGSGTNGPQQVEEEKRPMSYVQTFQLLPDGAGSYFIFNDVFRLVYPASG